MRPHVSAAILSSLFASLAVSSAHAIWMPNGVPVTVAPSAQNLGDVATDSTGGVFVVWQDGRDGLSSANIYAQHLTPAGLPAPGWAANGMPVCMAEGFQTAPVAVEDGAGGVYVAWTDNRVFNTGDVYLTRLGPNGSPSPGWPTDGIPVCTAENFQENVRVIRGYGNDVYVAWVDYRPGPDERDIYLQHILPDGSTSPGWPGDGLAVVDADGLQLDVELAIDGVGGVILCWDDTRNNAPAGTEIFALRINPDGSLPFNWPDDGILVSEAGGRALQPEITHDITGGAYIVWLDERDGSPTDLYAGHVLSSGILDPLWPVEGARVSAADHQQLNQQIAPDGLGGFLVVWADTRNNVDFDVYGIRMLQFGVPAFGWTFDGVNLTTLPDYQQTPYVTGDGAGGMFAAWHQSSGSYSEIRGQRLTANGALATGWSSNGLRLGGEPTNSTGFTQMAGDGNSPPIAVWGDSRDDLLGDLYAQHLVLDVPVPVQSALVSVDVTPERVAIVWELKSPTVGAIWVERRVSGGEWIERARVSPDGTGRVRHEERELVPGTELMFRLTWEDAGEIFHSEESVVRVPATSLALGDASLGPGGSTLSVAFSLASSNAAALELYDVTGRRWVSRDVGSLGAGSHGTDLDVSGLPAGLYLVRLTQDDRALVARAMIAR